MSWGALREQLSELVAGFDPDAVSVADAQRVLAEASAIVNLASVARARAAARVAATGRWRTGGARTPAQDLARRCGLSVGEARRVLATGEQLATQPVLLAAGVSGQLSPTQVELVADAATADPGAAGRLLARARETSVAGLREECLRAKASADPDPEASARRLHARRGWRSWTDADGSARTTTTGSVEDLAWLRAALEPERQALFHTARRHGHRVPDETLDYDALMTLLRRGAGLTTTEQPTQQPTPTQAAGEPSDALPRPRGNRAQRRAWSSATVIVRVDATAAERGRAVEEELCEIAGTGPIPLSTVRGMLAEGAALAIVATRGDRVETVAHVRTDRAPRLDLSDPAALSTELARSGRRVADVIHPRRRPTAHQQTALRWTSPTCTVTGCPNPRCDIDHRTGWALTRTTRLDDLDPLCRFHHNLKTRHHWALINGHGPRALVPPEHPHHPRHTRAG